MHKVDRTIPSFALKTANFFGALGYVSLVFEWMWVFGLLLYPAAEYFKFLVPAKAPTSNHEPLFVIDGTVAMIVGGIITVLCLGMVMYAFFAVPRSVAKTGARVTRITANSVMPTITRHHPVTKKVKKRLTFIVITYIKATVITLPLLVSLFIQGYPSLPGQIISIVAAFFAIWALINFAVQLAVTKIAKLDTNQVW